jgi:diguanylate cyclase (GGDEF)-like protein/PAS domain S-box-containing protein
MVEIGYIMGSSMGVVEKRKKFSFLVVSFGLIGLYAIFRGSQWQGSTNLHTMMEIVATVLALMIGISGLIRFYAKPDEKLFLFIGAGFLGTGFLDGYHAIVTSEYFIELYPSPPESLIPWSWVASRLYLSIFLFWAYIHWKIDSIGSYSIDIEPKKVYLITATTTFASFIFFAFVPLPKAYYSELFFHRPEELLPALFFALALYGFYRKGEWRENSFEYWLVMALIVSLISQVIFMSFSEKLFDYEFDMAHLLKKASYISVLTGIYISMLDSFQKEVTLSSALQFQKDRLESINSSLNKSLKDLEKTQQIAKIGSFSSDVITGQSNYSSIFLNIFGLDKDSNFNRAKWLTMVHPDDISKVKSISENIHNSRDESATTLNYRIITAQNSIKHIEVQWKYRYNENGEIVHLDGFVQDVTDRVLAEEKRKAQFETIYKTSKDGLAIIDLESNFIDCNNAYLEMTGYSKDELFKKSCIEMSVAQDIPKTKEVIANVQKNGFVKHFKKSCYKKDGTIFTVDMSLSMMPDSKHILISTKDVTELISVKNRLDYQINFDSLTSLPNRTLFMDRLYPLIKRSARNGSKAAIVLLDIDHLKGINDSFGIHSGDIVIQNFSKWITESVRDDDTVARFSGNTFGIIMEDINDNLAPTRVLEHLNSITKNESINIAQNLLHITFSSGIAIYPDDGVEADILYKNADAALYSAKDAGRNTYRYYTNELTDKAFERVIMETNLREALKKDEFLLYYQPQINTKDNSIIGLEALLRWKHSSMGLILPYKFIPILESSNLMIDVGEFILKRAFTQAVVWREQGLSPGILSVNLSIIQLNYGERLIKFIEKALKETGCKASWIGLEVTESMMIKNPEVIIKLLQRLKDMGFMISVDDFGTGYSSLSYLKRLPIDKLKLDKSFVDGLPYDKNDIVLSKTIISMASSLTLKIIAEGVENEEQKKFLIDNRCNEIQGYLYSKPLPEDEISLMLKSADR